MLEADCSFSINNLFSTLLIEFAQLKRIAGKQLRA
jgi:hypothetical protein